MIWRRHVLGLIFLACSLPLGMAFGQTETAKPEAAQSASYKPGKGPYALLTKDEDWRDEARNRTLPVRLYLPAPKPGEKLPVIIFSHGWGASRTSYGYFCEHLASEGYLVICPSHPGSDTASIPFGNGTGTGDRQAKLRERLLNGGGGGGGGDKKDPDKKDAKPEHPKQEGLMESIEDPDNLRNRPRDISFIIDQLDKQAATRDLADLSHIGVGGHSFGAYTAMAIGGMTVKLPDAQAQSFRDPRVKAVLPMSPEGRGTMGIETHAWDHFGAPVLFLTGTRDYGSGDRPASWRRQAFDAVSGVDDYLVTIEGAGHLTFAMPMGEAALIQSLGTAFLDAYLRQDAAAKIWLQAFFAAKHTDCTAEFKPGAASPKRPQDHK
jgi:predicted dienelactone hydrolase